MRPLEDLAADLQIDARHVIPWGPDVAKLHLDALAPRGQGRYALVTAMTPNRRGVGKTTVSIALGDALRAQGHRTAVTIRQSSMGPTFGAKGGGAGGGAARVVPLTRSLLHLTGDMHAVTAAHNLVAALLDNAWHHGRVDLITADVQWNRVADVNDRFLRSVEVGSNDKRRQTQFELTAASELMAILALVDGEDQASVAADLRERVGRIVLAMTDGGVITAEDIQAAGAASALLLDAVQPNLMQSADGTPVLIHAGPFANIAHGCSSIVADRIALAGADWVITEAGFGAEIGAEKFFDIKCRASGLFPDVAVLVATVDAVMDHGTVEAGLQNLTAQIANVRRFGIPVVVAINAYPTDDRGSSRAIMAAAAAAGADATVVSHGYRDGADGALALADAITDSAARQAGAPTLLYGEGASSREKLEIIARQMYGAAGVQLSDDADRKLARFMAMGADALPVCVAKTPFSLSGDPLLKGAPTGHILQISDVRLSAGAGFVYALTSQMITMPGMSADPLAAHVDVDAAGVTGIS